ncbi:RiPP maturation radical SAM C-methyltransferase [Tropicibacter sp. S64]|uniref:RiPP maturation radical SAM C-methyltransferase n=1 Tax=Tropicibacter sp. S64 TaxID=3415122 RepID=UPI003C7C375F
MNKVFDPTEDHHPASQARVLSVGIVVMPFASVAMPSIQAGTVAGIAQAAGFAAQSYHFNLDLAVELGEDLYESLCEHRGVMSGEWLFAIAAHGAHAPDQGTGLIDDFPHAREALIAETGLTLARLHTIRHDVLPAFVDRCARALAAMGHDVIGLTSTFQQTNACLALAKRIKALRPRTTIIMGGANCDHPMGGELVRVFEAVDYAVSGEAEVAFPSLLSALDAAIPQDRIRIDGVVSRANCDAASHSVSPLVRDLDVVPIPIYDEFFERSANLGLAAKGLLPMETSRGCWWGVRHHCTFCGLNGHNMRYRMKSAPRVLDELEKLSLRHDALRFETTDNILAPKFVQSVFASMAERNLDLEFFFEVKTNLKRDQLAVLAAGGLRRVQPGIESLSTALLTRLRKGSSAIENVHFMKWCLYHGIKVSWNLLCGIPGERPEDYAKQLDLLRKIPHLEPPSGLTPIWLERYSPLFNTPGAFGISDVRPEASYAYAFPREVDLANLAYFFDYSVADTCSPEVLRDTEVLVQAWQADWDRDKARHMLTFTQAFGTLTIRDRRKSDHTGQVKLTGLLAEVYRLCAEAPVTVQDLMAKLERSELTEAPDQDVVQGVLEAFCETGLAFEDEGLFLGLALPRNQHWT